MVRQVKTKNKTKILFASNNPGKIREAQQFANRFKIKISTPKDFGIDINPHETGSTYKQNAYIKAKAYKDAIGKDVIVIADDAGIEIPILNNEPGVFSRRYKGYEMEDQEIIDYWMERMQSYTGKDRDANFVVTLAVVGDSFEPQYFTGKMECLIVDQVPDIPIITGFPFVSIMQIKDLGILTHDLYSREDRGDYLTHRDKALINAFEYISKQ